MQLPESTSDFPFLGAITGMLSVLSATFAIVTLKDVQIIITIGAGLFAMVCSAFAVYYYYYAAKDRKLSIKIQEKNL